MGADHYDNAEDLRAEYPDMADTLLGIPGYDPWVQQQAGQDFSVSIAIEAVSFFADWLRHVKGRFAGEPFALESWEQAIIANLWGWRNADGTRRYRRMLLYVGKKNGKSALSAGIILLSMATDGEQGSEVYSVASTQKQAGNVFDHAAGFVRLSPELKARFKVLGDKGGTVSKSIIDYRTMSSYKCLSSDADSADGVNPHLNVIDELHRHKSGELSDILERSTSARVQPLTVYTTTADYNRESACNSLLHYARLVRANKNDEDELGFDPGFLPAIWEASADDDPGDIATWRKANPGLGTVKSLEQMRQGWREAQTDAHKMSQFLRLDLNIVMDAKDAWIPMAEWDACAGDRKFAELVEAMRGERCYGGLDLAATIDLTAFVLFFPDHGVVLPWFWIPESTAKRAERKSPKRYLYSTWSRDGYLTITQGDVADYEFVEKKVLEVAQDYDLRIVGYDPWNARHTAIRLESRGVKMLEMRQGAGTLGEATKRLHVLWKDRQLVHGGHPVLRWNAQNVMVREDANKNIVPSKGHSSGQIDGIAALVMAITGDLAHGHERKGSVYAERGIRTL